MTQSVDDAFDHVGVAYDQRRALMEQLGLDVEDALSAVRAGAARLFGHVAERVRFIAQAQFAGGRLDVARVEEDAALEQVAVEIGDQRADVAQALVGAQLGDRRLHLGMPVPLIALVHRVGRALGRDPNLVMRMEKLARRRVEREAVHTTIRGYDQHRR